MSIFRAILVKLPVWNERPVAEVLLHVLRLVARLAAVSKRDTLAVALALWAGALDAVDGIEFRTAHVGQIAAIDV